MAAISLALIKQVREDTGAGMMAVKAALTEADGDVQKAKDILREKGVQAAGKREGRKAQEGLVAYKVVEENGKQVGYAVELNAETDFVAETPQFVQYGNEIVEAMVAAKAATAEQILAAKTAQGTVADTITEAGALFKEHVKLGQFARIEGERVDVYAHKKSAEFPPSTVAMVATDEKAAEVAHDVNLQISAMAPKWLTEEDVPQDVIDHETEVETNKFREQGKPEKIIPNIVKGAIKAFFKDTVLVDQAFVKDPKVTVGQLVEKTGGKLEQFVRIEVGKGEEEAAEESSKE